MELATQIKTFTEGAADSDIQLIRSEIIEAENIVFLGFAFHDLNMQLLGIDGVTPDQTVLATAVNISDNDIGVIQSSYFDGSIAAQMRGRLVFRSDLTCHKLFSEFWRTMSS